MFLVSTPVEIFAAALIPLYRDVRQHYSVL
jgi:hypothetical protein